jgi:hypothetical protein
MEHSAVRIKEWFHGERGSISSKWVFIRNLPNDVNILVMTDNMQKKEAVQRNLNYSRAVRVANHVTSLGLFQKY